MNTVRHLWMGLLVLAAGQGQTADYPADQENVLQRTIPGRQLFKEDEPCGGYLWKSVRADRAGAVVLYFFYGSTEYGKSKLGMYQQSRFRAVVSEDKNPPTAQVINEGKVLKEVLVKMTQAEFESARACFPRP